MDKRLPLILIIGFDQAPVDLIRGYSDFTEAYDIELVNHPLEAIEQLRQGEHFDGFLIDFKTLKETDFKLLDELKRNEAWRAIPVIALHCYSTSVNIPALLARGLDDCFVQPVDAQVLLARFGFLNRMKSRVISGIPRIEVPSYSIPLPKRIFDIAVSSIALIILAIPFLFISLAIFLEDRGAPFYSSKRAGTGYKTFGFLKFRSMVQNADSKIQDIQHLNTYGSSDDNDEAVFIKIPNDPRVTRVGKFLRKTSIDELPQLINVLKGDMSIVGNRPLPLYEAELLTKDEWAQRFIAPAGLTGLWQVARNGKDNMSAQERINLDIQYSHNHSLASDMSIILRTIPAMLQKVE